MSVTRRRRFIALALAALPAIICAAVSAGPGPAPAGARPAVSATRVLFLGNSYTYFSNLPAIFVKLAAARNHKVEVVMLALPGWRLKDHWERSNSREVLQQGRPWDYVVLQEQSTLGTNTYVDGRPRVSGDEIFRPYADRWTAEVRAAGATPVFYLTWARKATPQDQAALNSACIRAAKAGAARVAPVGMAWATVRREDPSLELFQPDGSHPSAAGSYLAACTLFAAIFNESPVGLPSATEGAPVNPESGVPEPTKTVALVDLGPDTARVLQDSAWDAWQQTTRPGFFDVEASPPLAPPPLPAGLPLDPGRVAGTWKGSFALYPSLRTDTVLKIGHGDSSWVGHLELKYHAKDAPDQSIDLGDLQVGDRELSFTNPAAWQGPVMRFRGVSPRVGVLRGTVEAVRADPDNPMRLLGTWELRKR
jgi:hypothetical protein